MVQAYRLCCCVAFASHSAIDCIIIHMTAELSFQQTDSGHQCISRDQLVYSLLSASCVTHLAYRQPHAASFAEARPAQSISRWLRDDISDKHKVHGCSKGILAEALYWVSGCSTCCCQACVPKMRQQKTPSLLYWPASKQILICIGRTSCCGLCQRCLLSA